MAAQARNATIAAAQARIMTTAVTLPGLVARAGSGSRVPA